MAWVHVLCVVAFVCLCGANHIWPLKGVFLEIFLKSVPASEFDNLKFSLEEDKMQQENAKQFIDVPGIATQTSVIWKYKVDLSTLAWQLVLVFSIMLIYYKI